MVGVLAGPFPAEAGDILRGGAVQGGNKRNAQAGRAGAEAAAAAKAKAQDRLARTTQVLQSVRSMQDAARAAARGASANGLAVVPDGLAVGGLDLIGTPDGAHMPVQSGNHVSIVQSQQQALLNWKTFNIGKNTTLQFDQTAGGSDKSRWIAFNRVFDPSGKPSQILGSIKADGQVYVLNQNGIIFGGASQVNVHTLVASSLPINDNLVRSGLLNNPDLQFLFTAIPEAAGAKGTSEFIPPPPLTADGLTGDVVVLPGAQLTAPTTAAKVGGRIALVGANVRNEGTISTPDGQTILAAGLQVGMTAHPGSDPSLRGVDVWVGETGNYAGAAINSGLIEAHRGGVTMTGRKVGQFGVIDSTTSVSLNGRIDLIASHGAVANSNYNPDLPTSDPFLFRSVGSLELGPGSVTRILPEIASDEKAVGVELALRSQINLKGRSIHLGADAAILAPNANVTAQAGRWDYQTSFSNFLYDGGQIYLDSGAWISAAGTTDVTIPLLQRILTIQLRGAELADSPLQRTSSLRGVDLVVDSRKRGVFNGQDWVGTPLGDVSGFVDLIESTAGQLTVAGGSVKLLAGDSVVINRGADIDVSGGWVMNEGGRVQTTRLLYRGHIINIEDATPDRLYDGIFTDSISRTHAKWGITKNYKIPLAPTGAYHDQAYLSGADAGSLTISARTMALDGKLSGATVTGPRQLRKSPSLSSLPKAGELSLAFESEVPGVPPVFPEAMDVIFQSRPAVGSVEEFRLDASGEPLPLSAERRTRTVLSSALLTESGFGSLSIRNTNGNILVPGDVELNTVPGGSLMLEAANVDVNGKLTSPGGALVLRAYNIPPLVAEQVQGELIPLPGPSEGRGVVTLGPEARLSVAGTMVDDRPTSNQPVGPIVADGGRITIEAFTADLAEGSEIDASGGMALTSRGDRVYGNGGSIVIRAGRDISLTNILGGDLKLGARLSAYSRLTGGALTLQAGLIQVGGTPLSEKTFLLQPEFFHQGGFASFTLDGLGAAGASPGQFLPGLFIAPGTIIEPAVESVVASPFGGKNGSLAMRRVRLPVGERPPVKLAFNALGTSFQGNVVVRGDLIMGEGAAIRTDPLGSVSLSGDTAAVLGSVYAPGGTISIRGSSNSVSLFNDPFRVRSTVYIGSKSVLSAAGTTLLRPDPYGRRLGAVLPGGTINVTGNIVMAAGAMLDVSGATDVLDLTPFEADPSATLAVPGSSGLTSPLYSLRTVPTRLDSDGGSIVLTGGQLMVSDATLLGRAGGPTAWGGSLSIRSGRFYPQGSSTPHPTDSNLIVRQSGLTIPVALPDDAGAIGQAVGGINVGRGYFSADTFVAGGFSSLALNGVVEFRGPVTINADRALKVADGGVLYADSDVKLSAPYVALGLPFPDPVTDENLRPPFDPLTFPPVHGSGRLFVSASLIDVGTLSLQKIGFASLAAENGDIRGNGILNIAGDLVLRAGQVYPTTAGRFTIVAYDHAGGLGSVTVEAAGQRALPLSAGGQLSIFASVIHQNGVLRAPFGAITLGWDGSGTPPTDLLAGSTLPFPVTRQLSLGEASVTSVSGIDPLTGKGVLIPYGYSLDGETWIDPFGEDISGGGLPVKTISLSALNLATAKGSVIDIRGGGDLYGYRWVEGNGGTSDILASSSRFAVIPGYESGFAPRTVFAGEERGYENTNLAPGDRIYLGASQGLPAGYYTLLPARYALLPGAFLVTPQSGVPMGTIRQLDGSSLVSGYRVNDLTGTRQAFSPAQRFEVAPAATFRQRAHYDDFYATAFLRQSAEALGISTPRLPGDAGHLVFQAVNSLAIAGQVLAQGAMGHRAGLIDISSTSDIVIGGPGTGGGGLVLDSQLLSSFGAESLLIGGVRTIGANGTTVTVKTPNLTVDNAGAPLVAPDIILAAKRSLTLAPGAVVSASGALPAGADNLFIGDAAVSGSGDGTLLRATGDTEAQIFRSGLSSTGMPKMTIGRGATISGAGITLDSTYATSLDPEANLRASAMNLNSGQISLLFDNPGSLQPTVGLVLGGAVLQDVQAASLLSLLSYSSMDIYGTGVFNAAGRLLIHAAEIRGFNNGGGTVVFHAPDSLVLDNSPGRAAVGAVAGLSGSLIFNARTVQLGANQLNVSQYANLRLAASGGVLAVGTGGLATQGDLTVAAPLIAAGRSATQALVAQGSLILENTGGEAQVAGGLGGNLTLKGAKVTADIPVVLRSGLLTLHATTGDLTVNGRLDVGGTRQTFYDLVRYTDAGVINLIADHGSINLGAGSQINVAAEAGGGDAGRLSIRTPNGNFSLAGGLTATGGSGGLHGSFLLDAGSLSDFGTLNTLLNVASFTEARAIRVRSGDVLVDGYARARNFHLSVDQGAIWVSGVIDASGPTGGSIILQANGDVTLLGGSLLTVAGQRFSNAGKGGSVTLEAGAQRNGVEGPGFVDIQAGATIDLSVASKVSLNANPVLDADTPGSSAWFGQFSGKLHIRAPQNAAHTDLQVQPLAGTIIDPSSILIEGYRLYDLTDSGGTISTAVQNQILSDGQAFLGAVGTTTAAYTAMENRLLAGNASLSPVTVLAPGAEIFNGAVAAPLDFTLGAVGNAITIPSTGGAVLFPNGTGTTTIRTSAPATITTAEGITSSLAANTPVALAPGSTLTLNSGGSVTYASGVGAIAVSLTPGSSYTTGASGVAGTVSVPGTTVTLNAINTSSITLAAGTVIAFPDGTPGTRRIRSTVAGTITSAAGVVTVLAANTATLIEAGSTITLSGAGTITATNVTGGAIPVVLASGSFVTGGPVTATPATGDLVLGSASSTAANDWSLHNYRFGPKSAPGVLTMRATGNLMFYNALSDGFASAAYNALLLPQNPLLPINTQSWSFRLTSGADLSAADYGQMLALEALLPGLGSLKLGKDNGQNLSSSPGPNAVTSQALTNRYQVIRTGSGDIDIHSGRSVQLLNQFASIFTAGTRVADYTLHGLFDVPVLVQTTAANGPLGAAQQSPTYAVQYSVAGGNVSLEAQENIEHLTRSGGLLVEDSQRQLPVNWLYRRGYVDPATGVFGRARNQVNGDIASTTWWVDFSNFFQGIGALGGGDVTLIAGGDISNVDAAIPTNARMIGKNAGGLAIAPDAANLLELGGGDLRVRAGVDLDAGVYYLERGFGSLEAGRNITTNATRSPNIILSPGDILDARTWLPTTLFLGKGGFDVNARGDVLIGPAVNPFLLPGGINNTFWYKTYFSTYAPESRLSVSSLSGDITFRLGASMPATGTGSATPLVWEWFKNQLLLTSNPNSASYYQPWLRLNETNVTEFLPLASLLPPTLQATAFDGDVNILGAMTLYPAARGSLEILASGAINGLQPNGQVFYNNVATTAWGAATVLVSDANPASIPGIASPFAYQTLVGTISAQARSTGAPGFLSFITELFGETGSLEGVLENELAVHTPGGLHKDDTAPLRLYAGTGDISGLALFSPKAAQIFAGRDITDVAFYIQHVRPDDISVVASGRDIIPYNANSLLRLASVKPGNIPNISTPLAGDIQISGAGALEVLAGRHLDLGLGQNQTDGTGVGITSVGNARNPYLNFGGADLVIGAGLDLTGGLSGGLNYEEFLLQYAGLHAEVAGEFSPADYTSLSSEAQARLALRILYRVLRDAGRNHATEGTSAYEEGFAAIRTLFGDVTAFGNILTRSRDIRTKNGGNIEVFAPGGKLTLANTTIGDPQIPPGIVTESGGVISIFTRGDVDIGIGRIFTLRGGDAIIWSSEGDIAAGAAAKTVKSAPPTRVIIDPQSADVQTDLAGLATGGGIGVLATVANVEPGDVDLIAPVGTVDAGDAGIRATGNLSIAATQVLNADNINVGGQSSGVPAPPPPPAAPNIAGLTSAASTAGAAANAANQVANQSRETPVEEEEPSVFVVEILGYGGGEEDGTDLP